MELQIAHAVDIYRIDPMGINCERNQSSGSPVEPWGIAPSRGSGLLTQRSTVSLTEASPNGKEA